MNTFPLLSTGAVTQYPSPVTVGQGVQVIRFMDGTDQRYLSQGKTLRRWEIRLRALTESETQAIEAFFEEMSGDYSAFNFTDPFTGNLVPNCRFGTGTLVTEYVSVNAASASFWVIETNG